MLVLFLCKLSWRSIKKHPSPIPFIPEATVFTKCYGAHIISCTRGRIVNVCFLISTRVILWLFLYVWGWRLSSSVGTILMVIFIFRSIFPKLDLITNGSIGDLWSCPWEESWPFSSFLRVLPNVNIFECFFSKFVIGCRTKYDNIYKFIMFFYI